MEFPMDIQKIQTLQSAASLYGTRVTGNGSTFSDVLQNYSGIQSPATMDDIFAQASETYGVPLNLLKAVAKAESNFQPEVTSRAGAMGVMQLMPATAESLGVTDPYDARQNIMGGAKYLANMLERYDGDVTLALAAYNAGSGNVKKYGGVPPFKETRNYIQKVLNYMGQDLGTVGAVPARSVEDPGIISKLGLSNVTSYMDLYLAMSGMEGSTTPEEAAQIKKTIQPLMEFWMTSSLFREDVFLDEEEDETYLTSLQSQNQMRLMGLF